MGHFEEVIRSLSRWLNYIASGAVVVMMALVVIDIIARDVGAPIICVYEVVGYLGAMVISFALLYTTVNHSNICISFLVQRFSPRTQAIIDTITCTICIASCFFIASQGFIYGTDLWRAGQISGCLRISYFPFMYVIAAILLLVGLAFAIDLGKLLGQVVKK